jgi:hypothetical protein
MTSQILVMFSFACLLVHLLSLLSTNIASNVSDGKRYKARSETGCSVIISADNWQYLCGDKKFWMSLNARLYSYIRQYRNLFTYI